jgi:hypothetical protein
MYKGRDIMWREFGTYIKSFSISCRFFSTIVKDISHKIKSEI